MRLYRPSTPSILELHAPLEHARDGAPKDRKQFLVLLIREPYPVRHAALQARVGLEELLHFLVVPGEDGHERADEVVHLCEVVGDKCK